MTMQNVGYRISGNVQLQGDNFNLQSFMRFALGDPVSFREIVAAFLESGRRNAELFRQYLMKKDIHSIAELSHKMLPMFRYLEAQEVVRILTVLKQDNPVYSDTAQYQKMAGMGLAKIELLLDAIGERVDKQSD